MTYQTTLETRSCCHTFELSLVLLFLRRGSSFRSVKMKTFLFSPPHVYGEGVRINFSYDERAYVIVILHGRPQSCI